MTERFLGRAATERNARLLRREPLCRLCRAKDRVTAATEVDHIRPLCKGGTEDELNLQPLCADCHKRKTAEDFGKHRWPTIGPDGWPVDE
ncbi:MAG: HNH endonuclease [Gammaproteobacteria bacterium]